MAVVLICSLAGFDYSAGYNVEFVILRQILRTVHSGNEVHWFGFVYRFIVGKSAILFYCRFDAACGNYTMASQKCKTEWNYQ